MEACYDLNYELNIVLCSFWFACWFFFASVPVSVKTCFYIFNSLCLSIKKRATTCNKSLFLQQTQVMDTVLSNTDSDWTTLPMMHLWCHAEAALLRSRHVGFTAVSHSDLSNSQHFRWWIQKGNRFSKKLSWTESDDLKKKSNNKELQQFNAINPNLNNHNNNTELYCYLTAF